MTYCVGPRKPYSVYLAYALFCEGPSDFAYFEVLIPRLIDSIVSDSAFAPWTGRTRLHFVSDSRTAPWKCRCDGSVSRKGRLPPCVHPRGHGGTEPRGSPRRRSVAYCRKMHEICDFPQPRCVLLLPRHETEAWALADPNAVLEALGYSGSSRRLGVTEQRERGGTSPEPQVMPQFRPAPGQQQPAAPSAHAAARHRPTSIDRRVETIGILQRLRIPTQDGAARSWRPRA